MAELDGAASESRGEMMGGTGQRRTKAMLQGLAHNDLLFNDGTAAKGRWESRKMRQSLTEQQCTSAELDGAASESRGEMMGGTGQQRHGGRGGGKAERCGRA